MNQAVTRYIVQRVEWSGELVALTPLQVGACGIDVGADLPLTRNGAGDLCVPAASLAGILRSACRAAFDASETEAVWGSRADEGCVTVEDGSVALPQGASVEIRENVAIDRIWAIASSQNSGNYAILPRGTRIRLRLVVETADRGLGDATTDSQLALAMLGCLRRGLQREQIRLGAGATRGLGRIKFREHRLTRESTRSRDDLLQFILRRLDTQPDSAAERSGQAIDAALAAEIDAAWADRLASGRSREPAMLMMQVRWNPTGPLMVRAGSGSSAAEAMPMVSGVEHEVALVLPGGSIKGAMRSAAERIVQTVIRVDTPRGHRDGERRRVRSRLPLISAIFGSPGRRGALAVEDCYADRPLRFGREQWHRIESADDAAALLRAVEGSTRPDESGKRTGAGLNLIQGAAVDRWTGGAVEQRTYSILAPSSDLSGAWSPLRLSLDWSRIAPEEQAPAMALILLVLRDLAAGRVPLGYGVNRGMGHVSVEDVGLVFEGAAPEALVSAAGQPRMTLAGGRLDGLGPDLLQALQAAWQGWVEKHAAVSSPQEEAAT